MPQFTVPQFEVETKIVWIFTFRQLIIMGIAAAICFFFYFTFGKTHLLYFLILATIIITAALALALLKVGGQGLPTILKNFIVFLSAPKIYLWRKKDLPPKFIRRAEKKIEVETEPTPTLKFAEKSRLKKLSTQIETGNK